MSTDKNENKSDETLKNDINDKDGVPDAFYCECAYENEWYTDDQVMNDDLYDTYNVLCQGYASCQQCCREYSGYLAGY